MSVGSDPIECCVRGRFLCVCVTARRRGFRGGGLLRRGSEKLLSTCFARLPGIGFAAGGDRRGLPFPAVLRISARAGSSPWAFCVGAPRNFFRPVSRAFPASVSRRGGIGVGFLFPLCCAFRLVPALRRGPFASGLRETSFDLFRAPSRHRFRGGGGIGAGFLFPCAAHFGSRLVPVLRRPAFFRPRTMAGLRSFRTSAGGAGGGRHCFLSLRFGGRGPCWRFSRSGRLRTKVRIAFDRSKTRCMLRPFRAGPLPSAGPAAEEDGPSLSIRER